MKFFEESIEQFKELPPVKQWVFGGLAVATVAVGCYSVYDMFKKPTTPGPAAPQVQAQQQPKPVTAGMVATNAPSDNRFTAIPTTNRNQGLEELQATIQQMRSKIQTLESGSKTPTGQPIQPGTAAAQAPLPPGAPMAASAPVPPGTAATTPPQGFNPNAPVPPVDFSKDASGNGAPLPSGEPPKPKVASVASWDFSKKATKDGATETIILPASTGIEGVLLNGMYALPAAAAAKQSGGVGAGQVNQKDMGTPFVSRVKGDALLANGWRSMALNDCRVTGSGIASLSKERVSVTAEKLVCISTKGVIYEGNIKAYGVDVDGIEGLAGHAVSKQGRILAQALFTGILSGLGQAFSPTSLPSYNTNINNGQQQPYTIPNPSMLAGQGLGSGLQNTGAQLTKFFLQFAQDLFPVVEVNSGTRVTWILKESVELHRTDFADKEVN